MALLASSPPRDAVHPRLRPACLLVAALVLSMGAATACDDAPEPSAPAEDAGSGGADTGPNDDADTQPEPDAADAADVAADGTPGAPDAPDAPEADVEEDGGGGPTCDLPCLNEFGKNDKKLCPDPKSDWNCVDGCCEPIFKCASDLDCEAQGFEEGQCTDERFECRCEDGTGVCFTWYCGAESDCPSGQLCAAGACLPAPPAGELDAQVVHRPTVTKPFTTTLFTAEGYDPSVTDVTVGLEGDDVAWSSDAPDVVATAPNGMATGGLLQGYATLTAAPSGTGEPATVQVFNVVAEPDATFTGVLFEDETFTPLTGDFALVHSGSGELIASGAIPADGIVSTAEVFEAADLHVFGATSEWVSWLGVAPGATVYLPIARRFFGAIDRDPGGEILPETTELIGADIVQGEPDFSLYQSLGTIELTLTSFSFASGIFDFSLPLLLGANVERYFDPDNVIPGLDDSALAEIPGGLTFALDAPAIPEYTLAAPAGPQRLWTLGGRLDINELAEYVDDIFAAFNGGSIQFTSLLRALLPLFSKFWTTLTPDVEVAGAGETTAVTLDPVLRVPLGLTTSVPVPTLPAMGDLGWPEAVFLLAGAETPDGRFTPLGLTAGADQIEDEPADGVVDGDDSTPETVDPFTFSLAPLHTRLGGPNTRFTVALVAANVGLGGASDRPEAGSVTLVRQQAGNAMPAVLDAPPPFLPFPLNATWDADTRTVGLDAVEGADVQRVLLKGDKGAHWTVWVGDDRGSVVLPTPSDLVPTVSEDRGADPNLVLVNSIDLTDGVTPQVLAEPGGITLERLVNFTERTSFMDVRGNAPDPAGD